MNWLELKRPTIGTGSIYLLACTPLEKAYMVKNWLQQNRPNVAIIYYGQVKYLKRWQVQHWVEEYQEAYRDYTKPPEAKKNLDVMESFRSALKVIEQQHGYEVSEVVIVRTDA